MIEQATEFFIAHAGTSYHPDVETLEEGTARNARDLAGAELAAAKLGWTVEWSDDWDGDHSYLDQPEFDGYEVTECEMAQLYDADGDLLESLGCIDDADDDYRRVVAAQLMDQALDQLTREAQTRDGKVTATERRVVLAAAPPRRNK